MTLFANIIPFSHYIMSKNITLITLMYEKDFNEITISEIAEKANYNRGTFYAHYSSKEDLLNEVIEEKLEQLKESLLKPYLDTKILTNPPRQSHFSKNI